MKNLIYVLLGATIAVSCQKETISHATEVVVVDEGKVLSQSQFDSLVCAIEPLGYWDEQTLLRVVDVEGVSISPLTESEKYELLVSKLGDDRVDGPIETIVSKSSGNANINGGKSYWDCTPALLAQTISQIGQSCNAKAPNNYYTIGSSATTITVSDVIRAANGVSNTSFNDLINVEDIVYLYPVSGDGNWMVDVYLTYQGQQYVFSDELMSSGETIPGVTIGWSLIYDPIDGGLNGISIVGPMPGGITEILGTGDWPTPPDFEL